MDTAPDLVTLSTGDVEYADGAEHALVRLLRDTDDRSSMSDELEQAAGDWPTRYHTARARANAYRALDLPPSARVLEVGAGCGAVTRYLGETCARVTALEPMVDRATALAERVSGLDNVEVVVGTVHDLDSRAMTFDLIVVNGVLEYVGGDDPNNVERRRFLEHLSTLLEPHGVLVCAIENRIGVKYLAGSPEDHDQRSWTGVEGYRVPSPARTFTRAELDGLLASCGYQHRRFLHCMPDYKLARVVFSDELVDDMATRGIASRLPRFPSPDHGGIRPRGADEAALWRSFVEAGLGSHFANSFLVLASPSRDAILSLASADRLATVLNTERRRDFTSRADYVGLDDGSVVVRRRHLSEPASLAPIERAPLRLRAFDEPLVLGAIDFVDAFATSSESERRTLLQRWKRMVHEVASADWMKFDLTPTNLVLDPGGDLHAIDQEWEIRGFTADALVARGLMLLGVALARSTPASIWPAKDVRSLTAYVAHLADEDVDGAWFDTVVGAEAEMYPSLFGDGTTREAAIAFLNGLLDTPLLDFPAGLREADHRTYFEHLARELQEFKTRTDGLGDLVLELHRHVDLLRAQNRDAQSYIQSLETSWWWRVRVKLVTIADRFRRMIP